MSTSAQPKPGRQYVDYDEYIDFHLQKTRATIKTTELLTAGVGVSALVLGYILVFVLFDHWVVPGGFGGTSRLLMLLFVVLAAAVWVGWKVVLPYWKRVTGLYAAREIERHSPELNSTLLNLVDLKGSGRDVPAEIRTSLEKRAAVRLSHLNVDEVVDRRSLMRASYLLLAVVVAWCVYSLFSPKTISSSVWRALMPTADVHAPTETEILHVKPGDVEVPARSQVEVVVDLQYRGEAPENVMLYYSTRDGRFIDEPLEMRPSEEISKQYHCVLAGEDGRGIVQETTYRIEAGDAASREYRIAVVQSPAATVEELYYEYPAYMELPPRTRPGGHIDTWEGTKVTVTATANMPVTSARVLFSDTEDTSQRAEEVPMTITEGTRLEATLERVIGFRSDGSFPRFYRIECRNERGLSTVDPALYTVNIHPDKRPVVELLDPQRDLKRPANATVPLLIRAADPDFKLRSVTLRMEKNGQQLPVSVPLFDGDRKTFGTTFDWELDKPEFGFRPGDTVTYWIEARDNKPPTGNRTNTRRMRIDIVEPATLEQNEEQLQEDRQRQEERLEELRKQGEQSPEQNPQQEGEQEGSQERQQPGEHAEQQQEPGEKEQDSEQAAGGEQGENQSSDQQPQPGESQEQTGQGEQDGDQQYDPEGADDEEVTRKLLERLEQERRQQQQQSQEQPAGQPDQKQQEPSSEPKEEQKQPEGGAEQQPSAEKQSGAEKEPQQKGTPEGAEGESASPQQPQDPEQSPAGGGQKSQEPAAGEKQSGKAPDPSGGEQTPASDAANPQQQKGTGKEKGPATPDQNPGVEPTPAQDPSQLKREPGEKPALKPGGKRDPDEQPADLGDKTKQGTPDAASDRSQNPKKTDPKQSPPGEQPEDVQRQPTEPEAGGKKSPDDKPNSGAPQGNEQLKKQQPPQGESSKSEQGGEGGSNKPSDQGNSGSKQTGGGDNTPEPGAAEESPQPTGKSDGQQGAGQQSSEKSSGGEGGSKSNQTGGAESADGKATGQGADAEPQGAKSPSGGSTSGGREPTGGGSGRSGGISDGGEGGGEGGGVETPPEANEEYAKQAANLVLERLENDLKRGEVDQELLEELGWTEEDMRKFADRLKQNLGEPEEADAPQSKAQRLQFQEWLKSLDLKSSGRRRAPSAGPTRSVDSIDARQTPPPPEYRDLFEAFTRGLNQQPDNPPDGQQK